MKKNLLRQFPQQIRDRIIDQTIESYELRDMILKLIDKRPKFIIRKYMENGELDDFLEQKDLELIKHKLDSVLSYEWLYYRYKDFIRENMDKFIHDVAEVFAYTIMFQNKYEYDETDGKVKDRGSYNIDEYESLNDFLSDYELLMGREGEYQDIDLDNASTYLDSVAINYLHETLKKLLKKVYSERRGDFIRFFKIDDKVDLSDMEFDELEYEVFEVFDTELPIPDLRNPVGSAEDLIAEVGKVDAKLLFKLGKEAALKKEEGISR
ncbi:MAG: hypothetical protein GX660_12835 [Clostridiaceae bacterium]|nr:hypothetical protein [Clostridiaceae bacterium]